MTRLLGLALIALAVLLPLPGSPLAGRLADIGFRMLFGGTRDG